MKASFSDLQVLVTAGPTHEPIDPVRFIGNFSSGKMGVAIAEAFAQANAKVQLVMGPSNIKVSHPNISRTDVLTADEMYEACTSVFPSCRIAVLAAAVADYKVKNASPVKIKKSDDDILTLELVKNKDILAQLGRTKRAGQILGGFSLETHDELAFAQKKLANKNCDFIVMNSLNDAGAGFGVDTNKVTILTEDEQIALPLKPKTEIAGDIINFVFQKYFRDK